VGFEQHVDRNLRLKMLYPRCVIRTLVLILLKNWDFVLRESTVERLNDRTEYDDECVWW
jgi:hypothetical protein